MFSVRQRYACFIKKICIYNSDCGRPLLCLQNALTGIHVQAQIRYEYFNNIPVTAAAVWERSTAFGAEKKFETIIQTRPDGGRTMLAVSWSADSSGEAKRAKARQQKWFGSEPDRRLELLTWVPASIYDRVDEASLSRDPRRFENKRSPIRASGDRQCWEKRSMRSCVRGSRVPKFSRS